MPPPRRSASGPTAARQGERAKRARTQLRKGHDDRGL
jgi:hypothetical protein